MTSHEIVEIIESPNSNHGFSFWKNPLLYIRSSVKERTLHIKKNASLSELSGSLGDLGTLLPILLALSITGQISLTSSLIFGGLWNIFSGLMFRIPMCVQPMKAIAAVAISANLSIGEIMSAGLGVGAMIFILGITRTIKFIEKWTPIPIIRGIQLGAGMTLIIKAADMIRKNGSWGGSSWKWNDNYEWAILSFIFVFAFYSSKRMPTALILFIVGLIIAIIKVFVSNSTLPSISFNHPEIVVPTLEEFKTGFLSASLGQLPLTTLNSVIALAALSNDLFPERSSLNTVEKISVSIGIMNIVGCFFGSIPYCHGSGGLAGQYRFGARSEVSVLILGFFKLILGILFGKTLTNLLNYFPYSIIGIMLFVSGAELSSAARNFMNTRDLKDDDETKRNFTLVIITAGLLVGFQNDGIGYVGGMIGLMIATGFIANGAKVYISSRSRNTCDKVAKELSAKGPGKAVSIPADLQQLNEVQRLANEIKERDGKLHVLINNAGVYWSAPIASYSDEAFEEVMNLNVKKIFSLTQACLPLLEKAASPKDPARVINIGSISGLVVTTFAEKYAYYASKAALHHLTKVMAGQLSNRQITFNNIAPGPYHSKMLAKVLKDHGELIRSFSPLGRIGSAEDIAGTVIYLSSKAGSFTNGATIVVDGVQFYQDEGGEDGESSFFVSLGHPLDT
ncbi:20625_t:CDS:2 [Funneliformis geosporum]|uniref:17419_t:CDS:1 n=1 Tax=Funneliformis geosporum TaxID=1117311 RepID=A0A9W4SJY3_9GLOM|nr:20625_t:CDS:2 [Funneliformis geosporum]CAI2171028.1 17419_t:CDS:2 [Funneliformis geosporum]